MKILVFSFYFSPDLSAGSFRMAALVEALGEEDEVVVITTRPNRYASLFAEAPTMERLGQMTIHRLPVGAHSGSMGSQARNYLGYAVRAIPLALRIEADVVFVTSSRLFTAVLAAAISLLKRRPLYLDIRDIFVDTIFDVIRDGWFRPFRPLLGLLERFAVNRATRINLVSPGFFGYFAPRYPNRAFDLFTNGIDTGFLEQWERREVPILAPDAPFTVLYAGNVGDGQGIHCVLPEVAAQLGGRVRFVIQGDGGKLPALRKELAERGADNVELRPPVPREQLIAAYAAADALLVHLNDYPAFLRVLPSKLFEYGATGLPILAGVGGVAADLVSTDLPDAVLFAPLDGDALVAGIETLIARRAATGSQKCDRAGFTDKYLRSRISARMAAAIRATADGARR